MTVTFSNGKELKGHVAIVTGAGRGIGRSHALLLHELGASVIVNDIVGKAAQEVADKICGAGGNAKASDHDIAQPENGELLSQLALDSYGRLDVLVHNAGLLPNTAGSSGGQGLTPFGQITPDSLHRYMDVNLLSAFYVGQPAWRIMSERGYGRIVLTSSASIFGLRHASPYAASKAGLLGLVATLALEARADGLDIKANALVPAAITPPGSKSAYRDQFGSRLGPDNVAAALGYLATPACEVSGYLVRAGASYLGRVFLGLAQGWSTGTGELTSEEAVANFTHAMALEPFTTPVSTTEVYESMFDVVRSAEQNRQVH